MSTRTSKQTEKPKPFLFPEFCKACGRCIPSCPKNCISFGEEFNPESGFVPVAIDLEQCNGCGVCVTACPEPYGLSLADAVTAQRFRDHELRDPNVMFGPHRRNLEMPEDLPHLEVEIGPSDPLVIKGTHAAAIGAILAGCRHVYGYPITPSTEGAEFMARLLPLLDGVFLQSVSEVATVNHMYGTGAAGVPCMTFTSSPGFSLMLEGISYMIGAEIPAVFVDLMRGGPGLGNIGPEQADIKLVCRGLGHGNTQAIVLAPSTPQEMLDFTMEAFNLSFRYRNPVIVLGDGYLGQVTGRVALPERMTRPGSPGWAVSGDREHRGNLICSLFLSEPELEKHNLKLSQKYDAISRSEQRAEEFRCEDAEVLLVACNTPARMARGAVQMLRERGIKAGLYRPLTLWPFPVTNLIALLGRIRNLVVVEASEGQLEDELILSLGREAFPIVLSISHVRHCGGVLPQLREIVAHVESIERRAS